MPILWGNNICYAQRIDTLAKTIKPAYLPAGQAGRTGRHETPVVIPSTRDKLSNVPLKVDNDHSNQRLHSPKKATIMSAVLPGLGQIYNRKYWKLPIIYGGFAGLVYSIGFADKRYQGFKEAFILRVDGDPATIDKYDPQLINDETKYSQDGLLQLKDYYRRNRDLSYILTVGLYVLNIIDANVDAHFFDFDISKDLTLHINPLIYNNPAFSEKVTASLGLTLKL